MYQTKKNFVLKNKTFWLKYLPTTARFNCTTCINTALHDFKFDNHVVNNDNLRSSKAL